MVIRKRILIAPLDWGLGHATRCIPIIKELILQGDEVLIAAEGNGEQLLKKEFPEQTFISLRGYRIRYSTFLPVWFSIVLQLPKILLRIFREHRALKKIIRKHHIEVVISDNRYGLWNKKIHSVFITHQVMIKCPPLLRFLEPLLYRIHQYFIMKFNECWIPDDERKLSGDLTHHFPLFPNAKLIGTLSRGEGRQNRFTEKKYDVIGIVSGPEPHRTSFEKMLIRQFSTSNLAVLIVLGKPGVRSDRQINDKLRLVSHLESKELFEAISDSELVICRAGYSSIMDLVTIRKDAIIIPTPGQTEQVYLAGYLLRKKIFFAVDQKRFHLEDAMKESKQYSVKNFKEKADQLPEIISAWKKKINVP